MNIAVIKDDWVINTAVFDDLQTAQQFLEAGVWGDADEVVELPAGYGIGDSYIGSNWIKDIPDDPEDEPEEPPVVGTDQEAINEFVRGMMEEMSGWA